MTLISQDLDFQKLRRRLKGPKSYLQSDEQVDVNDNETTKAAPVTKEDAEELLAPAFPNGRRVSQVDQACCGGFKKAGVCVIS